MYSTMITPICTEAPKSAKSRPRTDAEVRPREIEREEPADGRDEDIHQDQCRPFGRAERVINDGKNQEDGKRHDEHQPAHRTLLALVFPGPVELVARRQRDLLRYFTDRLLDGAAQSRPRTLYFTAT